jgi:hypothetical protein
MCNKDKKDKKVSREELQKLKEIVISIKNDPEAMQQAKILTSTASY